MHINEHRHYLIDWIYKFICILKRFYDKADDIDYSVFIPPDRTLVFYNSLIIKKCPLNIAMVTLIKTNEYFRFLYIDALHL